MFTLASWCVSTSFSTRGRKRPESGRRLPGGAPALGEGCEAGMLACAAGSVGGRLLCSLIPPEKEEAVV